MTHLSYYVFERQNATVLTLFDRPDLDVYAPCFVGVEVFAFGFVA